MLKVTHSPRQTYSFADLVIISTRLLKLVIELLTGHPTPFIIFFIVMLSVWCSDLISLPLTSAFATLIGKFLFLSSLDSFAVDIWGELLQTCTSVLVGFLLGNLQSVRRQTKNTKHQQTLVLQQNNKSIEIQVEERTRELSDESALLLDKIAKQKQVEEEFIKALEKEKEINELKSRFMAMAYHEFQTPLSCILFSSCLLEDYAFKWTEEKKLTHLHRIKTSVERLTVMLNEMLAIGKAEAGKIEFEPAPIDVETFCHELVSEMQLTAGSGRTITFINCGNYQKIANGTLPLFDEKLLRHILSNLLSNAIKYSPHGSDVLCELKCSNEEAIFRVQDRGIGIPVQEQQRIFETFHRADNVGNIPGTGLGLAIVNKFVELHKGKITVESQVGVGTTFTVVLPLHLKVIPNSSNNSTFFSSQGCF